MKKKEIMTIQKNLLHYIEDSIEAESEVLGSAGTTDERICDFTLKKLTKIFKRMRCFLEEELAEL
jgi:hypothetical protein